MPLLRQYSVNSRCWEAGAATRVHLVYLCPWWVLLLPTWSVDSHSPERRRSMGDALLPAGCICWLLWAQHKQSHTFSSSTHTTIPPTLSPITPHQPSDLFLPRPRLPCLHGRPAVLFLSLLWFMWPLPRTPLFCYFTQVNSIVGNMQNLAELATQNAN